MAPSGTDFSLYTLRGELSRNLRHTQERTQPFSAHGFTSQLAHTPGVGGITRRPITLREPREGHEASTYTDNSTLTQLSMKSQ
jgi:hypothetical protein